MSLSVERWKKFRNVESDGLKNKLKLVFQKEEDKNLAAIMVESIIKTCKYVVVSVVNSRTTSAQINLVIQIENGTWLISY